MIRPVSSSATTEISRAGTPAPARVVPPQKTPVSRAQLRGALASAYAAEVGHAPSAATLDTLTAHVSHETAGGQMMHNYNFGGIKGRSPEGLTANTKTKEVFDGKETTIVDGFRAKSSVDAGARDYVRTMRQRFPAAMAQADRGDLDGFAHALKRSGYYTADEGIYAQALRRNAGPMPAPVPAPPTPRVGGAEGASVEGELFLATQALAKLEGALAGQAARILSPPTEDS